MFLLTQMQPVNFNTDPSNLPRSAQIIGSQDPHECAQVHFSLQTLGPAFVVYQQICQVVNAEQIYNQIVCCLLVTDSTI